MIPLYTSSLENQTLFFRKLNKSVDRQNNVRYSLENKGEAEWSQAEMSRAMKLLDIPETDIDKYFFCH